MLNRKELIKIGEVKGINEKIEDFLGVERWQRDEKKPDNRNNEYPISYLV